MKYAKLGKKDKRLYDAITLQFSYLKTLQSILEHLSENHAKIEPDLLSKMADLFNFLLDTTEKNILNELKKGGNA